MSKLVASGVLLAQCIRLVILSIVRSLGHRMVTSVYSFAEIFDGRVGHVHLARIPEGSRRFFVDTVGALVISWKAKSQQEETAWFGNTPVQLRL